MATVEVRAFGKLLFLFKKRNWEMPLLYELKEPMTAAQLRQELDLPAEDVEVVFINRLIKPLDTVIEAGDRVAFVPPGVPSIHRFNLGFYEAKQGRVKDPGK